MVRKDYVGLGYVGIKDIGIHEKYIYVVKAYLSSGHLCQKRLWQRPFHTKGIFVKGISPEAKTSLPFMSKALPPSTPAVDFLRGMYYITSPKYQVEIFKIFWIL